MRILALDSSGLVASVAVVEADKTIAEYTINYKKTHSQTLLPMLDEVIKMTGLCLEEMDAIAVSAGPGSFTGLRIGAATAKGLGLALGKPLIAVPTLDAMAYNLLGTDALVCPMMDARREQVYSGLYAVKESLQVIEKQAARSVGLWIDRLNLLAGELEKSIIFLGDGVPVYCDMLESGLCVPHAYAAPHMNRQRAAAVAALGIRYYEEGKTESAAEHRPEYLRVSQAERERLEKEREENHDFI